MSKPENPAKVAARGRKHHSRLAERGLKKRSFQFPIRDEQTLIAFVAELNLAWDLEQHAKED